MKIGTSLRFLFPAGPQTLGIYQSLAAAAPPGAFMERPMGAFDVAEQAKKGEPVQYGSWGVGSTGHFCGAILSQQAGIKLEHVPFSGTAKLANDLLGGHIHVATLDMATGTPLVQEGKLKALAVCGGRSPSLPDVASYSEQGVPFERSLSWVMYAPAGLAEPVARKLSEALKAALDDPEIKSRILTLGITANFVPGDQQRDINSRDIEAFKQVAKEAAIEIK